jgi:SOS response regulatory protein OraA/RecX
MAKEKQKLETFVISRSELRRLLIAFGVSEKNIESLLTGMEKAHRHVNVITFAGLLEKTGLDHEKISNALRRLGIDDLAIRTILNAMDEQKIVAETGRLFNAVVDFQ